MLNASDSSDPEMSRETVRFFSETIGNTNGWLFFARWNRTQVGGHRREERDGKKNSIRFALSNRASRRADWV